jgi:hypothetical protein
MCVSSCRVRTAVAHRSATLWHGTRLPISTAFRYNRQNNNSSGGNRPAHSRRHADGMQLFELIGKRIHALPMSPDRVKKAVA